MSGCGEPLLSTGGLCGFGCLRETWRHLSTTVYIKLQNSDQQMPKQRARSCTRSTCKHAPSSRSPRFLQPRGIFLLGAGVICNRGNWDVSWVRFGDMDASNH